MTEIITGIIDLDAALDKKIENLLKDRLDHYLEDLSFRIGQAYELIDRVGGGASKGTVFAEDLNIKDRVFLTGYTVTNNSPTAGSIAWADLHVVYNGVDHAITNGNTALQYVYFTPATTPTTLKTSATKPVLADGDVLLFVNESGVARNMLSDTNASLPRIVATNAVDHDALAPNAVESDSIKDGAVAAGKIGTGAINNSNLISGKVLNGANMVDGTVNTLQLANNAVDANKLGTGSINNANKFSGKVLSGANMVDGTVGGTQLGSGAVSASKLNILRHVMY
ncbi:hypothetical protein ACFVGV_06130 [Pseudarthrobacter scleromae]|uniref:hypothetical protein n=1 Tax=Pseudarthrobacter scleromae TaxID=158897 RepID=UPI0036296D6F